MQAGKYEDAGKYLQKAIKENGDRAEYYIAYGMYLNEQGEYDEALKQFKNAYQDTKNTIANVNNIANNFFIFFILLSPFPFRAVTNFFIVPSYGRLTCFVAGSH